MFGYLHVLVLLALLLGFNEVFRRSRWATIAAFAVLPVFLTVFIWTKTGTDPNSSVSTWFHWAKVYSVIAGVLWFSLMRQNPKLGAKNWAKWIAAGILAVNIAEAVTRDFQLGFQNGGLFHFMNAVAGILNIIVIAQPSDMRVADDKAKTMVWPKMTILWILAYDVWNMAYIWNCVPEHAGFGIAVLLAATLPVIWLKGSWLQNRAYTLAMWMMYVMSAPYFIDAPGNSFRLPDSPALMNAFSALALALNIACVIVLVRNAVRGSTLKAVIPAIGEA